ncbi:hypothetical protein CDD83_3188 [Cordyceps sp. RAO-2017]|nr:hypothetical protein CDD83_3188 [Cordyceps sp. RAO-2017]
MSIRLVPPPFLPGRELARRSRRFAQHQGKKRHMSGWPRARTVQSPARRTKTLVCARGPGLRPAVDGCELICFWPARLAFGGELGECRA